MTGESSRKARLDAIAPRRIRAQAAVWLTDLHGPHRTTELERKVQQWIDADPRHAAAFQRATDAWRLDLHLPDSGTRPALETPRLPRRLGSLVLAAAVCLCAAAIALAVINGLPYRAAAGQPRRVSLADGTDVTLSGSSRLSVRFGGHARTVTLEQGEALFHVSHADSRPFVVLLGDHKVIAVGTTFDVRRDDGAEPSVAVTLMEGRVAVAPRDGPDVLAKGDNPAVTLLNPGQRLRLSQGSLPRLDTPALDRITAWRKGLLIFDDVSLREAAHEFSRYGSTRIAIDPAVAGRHRVGGVFRIDDADAFAQAMAKAYSLRVVRRGSVLVLKPA